MAWYVGVALMVFGTVLNNLGNHLMSFGHIQKRYYKKQMRRKSITTEDMHNLKLAYKNGTWLLPGTIIFVVGALTTFLAFGFAAQSLLAALESVQFVSNVVFCKYVHGIVITRKILLSTLTILVGNVLVVIFSSHSSLLLDTANLYDIYIHNVQFQYYLIISTVLFFVTFTIYVIYSKARQRKEKLWKHNIVEAMSYIIFSTLLGAQAVLHSKNLSMNMQLCFAGNNQFATPFRLVLWGEIIAWILFAIAYINRINTGLNQYEPQFFIPVFAVSFAFLTIVCGGLFFDEFGNFTLPQTICFVLGVVFIFAGVCGLAPDDLQVNGNGNSTKRPAAVAGGQGALSKKNGGGRKKDYLAIEDAAGADGQGEGVGEASQGGEGGLGQEDQGERNPDEKGLVENSLMMNGGGTIGTVGSGEGGGDTSYVDDHNSNNHNIEQGGRGTGTGTGGERMEIIDLTSEHPGQQLPRRVITSATSGRQSQDKQPLPAKVRRGSGGSSSTTANSLLTMTSSIRRQVHSASTSTRRVKSASKRIKQLIIPPLLNPRVVALTLPMVPASADCGGGPGSCDPDYGCDDDDDDDDDLEGDDREEEGDAIDEDVGECEHELDFLEAGQPNNNHNNHSHNNHNKHSGNNSKVNSGNSITRILPLRMFGSAFGEKDKEKDKEKEKERGQSGNKGNKGGQGGGTGGGSLGNNEEKTDEPSSSQLDQPAFSNVASTMKPANAAAAAGSGTGSGPTPTVATSTRSSSFIREFVAMTPSFRGGNNNNHNNSKVAVTNSNISSKQIDQPIQQQQQTIAGNSSNSSSQGPPSLLPLGLSSSADDQGHHYGDCVIRDIEDNESVSHAPSYHPPPANQQASNIDSNSNSKPPSLMSPVVITQQQPYPKQTSSNLPTVASSETISMAMSKKTMATTTTPSANSPLTSQQLKAAAAEEEEAANQPDRDAQDEDEGEEGDELASIDSETGECLATVAAVYGPPLLLSERSRSFLTTVHVLSPLPAGTTLNNGTGSNHGRSRASSESNSPRSAMGGGATPGGAAVGPPGGGPGGSAISSPAITKSRKFLFDHLTSPAHTPNNNNNQLKDAGNSLRDEEKQAAAAATTTTTTR